MNPCFALSLPTLRPNVQFSRTTKRRTLQVQRPREPVIKMLSEKEPPAPEPLRSKVNSGPFGIRLETNGDVLKFGVIAIVLGYGMKYGIQTIFGLEDLAAGQWTTGILSVGTLLAWISTYVFRVGTKSMTYAQQLKDYEDAVIEKRYSELTEEELTALGEELEEDM